MLSNYKFEAIFFENRGWIIGWTSYWFIYEMLDRQGFHNFIQRFSIRKTAWCWF